jgi:hypothetical protein
MGIKQLSKSSKSCNQMGLINLANHLKDLADIFNRTICNRLMLGKYK